jgi:beta-glucanase (GH16 family)
VRAIGEEGRYIKTEERINVLAGDPIDIGEGYSTPINYQGMNLVWNDEFNGGALNTQDWSFDLGNGCPDLCGWGNNELEYYRKENCWVGNGVLTIEARKEDYQGFNYTSSKILTRGSQNFQFGRIDIRALLPQGQGIWPALWMLGSNISSVGWPKCGEIDIMEMAGGGGRENKVTANVFWDDNGKRDDVKSYTLPSGTFADEYHVFSLIWDQNEINWLVNDIKYHTVDITPETKNELRNPFFIILNVAVGGNYPGNPDATSIYPTQMKVDYVRVFQNF